ncbi:methyltransferase [Rheinheimera maricola]|uniref:SAM-dependent methyltransferase n=1 Tax=Rheinheimera maricola TaxID=2793282 RepID=A0ABS7XCT2_9GAMM|nr:methyltransferase [Rheinheimera maricola]MBZ9613351.1 SAM-dependent methyltransferase [Rheinheimera maricola]
MANSLQMSFQQLSKVLLQYRHYWQLLPFSCDRLPWPDDELHRRIMALDELQVSQIDQCVSLQQQHFAECFPALFSLPDVITATQSREITALPFWLSNGIAGRKLQQIDALCQHWPASQLPVVEWCAGKGHLGRSLAYRFGQAVTSIEWQPDLCQQGEEMAAKYELAQQFMCADVLAAPLQHVLHEQQHLVALHACGQLHITLLQQAVAAGCQQLHLVPCCYHLIPHTPYQPLSTEGMQHDLLLNKDDLKLVVQGQVTAGARIEKLRLTEVLWRLAYDELRIELSGQVQYRPLPSVAKHWFSADFADFARWAAAQHQLSLPAKPDWARYLQQAEHRAALVRRIDLVRHLFRRPLELWLALDKALYLQQHGYQVSLSELCAHNVTPRNVLLHAKKPALTLPR